MNAQASHLLDNDRPWSDRVSFTSAYFKALCSSSSLPAHMADHFGPCSVFPSKSPVLYSKAQSLRPSASDTATSGRLLQRAALPAHCSPLRNDSPCAPSSVAALLKEGSLVDRDQTVPHACLGQIWYPFRLRGVPRKKGNVTVPAGCLELGLCGETGPGTAS